MVSATEYYPFGMPMRYASSSAPGGEYRYGFNGKEHDWEVKGFMSQLDYGLRVYDPRIGRLLSTDPLSSSFPWYTPYQYAGNSPIVNIDYLGAQPQGRTATYTGARATRPALSKSYVDANGRLHMARAPVGPASSPGTPPYSGSVRVPGGWYVETPNGGYLVHDDNPFGPQATRPKYFEEQMRDDYIILSDQLHRNIRSEKQISLNNKFEILTSGEYLPDWYVQLVKERLLSGEGTANDWAYKKEVIRRGLLSPRFGESQELGRKPSGLVLGKNLERAGQVRPQVSHAAHHIVAGTDPRAGFARYILQREGIDINDADNGVFLEEGAHRKIHTNDYYRKIGERLNSAQRGKVREELNKIREEIKAGTF